MSVLMSELAILGWGTAVPRFQLTGAAVRAVLGTGSQNARAVASYDEDSTTLAVAAARAARAAVPGCCSLPIHSKMRTSTLIPTIAG